MLEILLLASCSAFPSGPRSNLGTSAADILLLAIGNLGHSPVFGIYHSFCCLCHVGTSVAALREARSYFDPFY